MIAATHIIFGAGCSVVFADIIGLDTFQATLVVAAGMMGSLLPDIDHPGSTFGRSIRPLSDIISFVFGHRGITHSLFMIASLIALLTHYNNAPIWSYGMVIGYFSHLLGDWLTPSGIPLLWPVKRKFRAPITVRTGGIFEMMIGASVLGIGFAWYLTK